MLHKAVTVVDVDVLHSLESIEVKPRGRFNQARTPCEMMTRKFN